MLDRSRDLETGFLAGSHEVNASGVGPSEFLS
jgi:hypothetical protein